MSKTFKYLNDERDNSKPCGDELEEAISNASLLEKTSSIIMTKGEF